jgi:hypothetical protein
MAASPGPRPTPHLHGLVQHPMVTPFFRLTHPELDLHRPDTRILAAAVLARRLGVPTMGSDNGEVKGAEGEGWWRLGCLLSRLTLGDARVVCWNA